MSDAMERTHEAIGRLQAIAAIFGVLTEVLKRPEIGFDGTVACVLICDEIEALREQATADCDSALADL